MIQHLRLTGFAVGFMANRPSSVRVAPTAPAMQQRNFNPRRCRHNPAKPMQEPNAFVNPLTSEALMR